jgi:hypothetical protein
LTGEHAFAFIGGVTADGTPATRFRRAIETRSVYLAELSAREMRQVTLLDALDYCWLGAIEAPDRYERAARRWFQRLAAERTGLTLDQLQLAASCLCAMPTGDRDRLRDMLRVLAGGYAKLGAVTGVNTPIGLRAQAHQSDDRLSEHGDLVS